jgi:zinc and cadmium transporter
MTGAQSLALYTSAILTGALVGGAIPLVGAVERSDALLSFSAGVMLGAAVFHMLPEAAEGAGLAAIPFVLAGFLFLFLLERFVLVHTCAGHGPGGAPLQAHGPPAQAGAAAGGCRVQTIGMAAFVGLSLHTLVDGFALGAASADRALGFFVFLAILAHKVPSSFSLSAILRAEGYSRRRALLMNAAFAAAVPLGAALYLALRTVVHAPSFTALALAASCGTFLHLALSDIIPDLHRRDAPRVKLYAALLGGMALMWALKQIDQG